MQAFVPKNRRIIDLNNIPLVTGTAYIKWRLPSSNANEHHGNTDKALIIDHRASWNYERTLQLRLTIDRDHTLHECEIQFDVIQEFSSGGHVEKNLLGRVKLNLSEYVDKSDDDEGIVRRYLMQDSKINSTLKIGIAVQQVEGDRNFTTPPLKSAMAFGGITGVVASEQAEADDTGQLPLINTQSREVADMQEMYRRTLAASWTSRADDLPADKLIEGLFSGAVGGADPLHPSSGPPAEGYANGRSPSRGAGATGQNASRNLLSPGYERRTRSSSRHRKTNKALDFSPAIEHTEKSGSIEHQLYDNAMGKSWMNRSTEHELSEFDSKGCTFILQRYPQRSNLCKSSHLFPMLSRSSRHAQNLLERRLPPICRIDIRASIPPHGIHARNRSWATKADERVVRPQPARRVPVGVSTLGKPCEVVVLREGKVPLTGAIDPSDGRESEPKIDGARFMLREIGENSLDHSSVTVESFREAYEPHTKLSDVDYKALRNKLQSSFTVAQLQEYYTSTRPGSDILQQSNSSQWIAGTSLYLEPDATRRETVASRVIRAEGLKNKAVIAEKILRERWQLGIETEIGQLDIRLPIHHLSLFMRAKHFSFEELANLNDASIDVMHTMGFLRVTGKQRSCENVAEMIQDATDRIRHESLDLPGNKKGQNFSRIFSPSFLSWVEETYGVSFEQSSSQIPERLFYLAENKEQAGNARRTLHLAMRKAQSLSVPFSTYMSASEQADVRDVNLEDNASWPDRTKSWFRWELSSTQTKSKSPSEFFFNTSQAALSDELLKFLQQKSLASAKLKSVPSVRESVTASVGKCLFMRPPSLEEKRVSASQLGRMSLPRTFIKDVPRAGPLMRSLIPTPTEEGIRIHRIRLVPAASHTMALPQLELEVASAIEANNGSDDRCVIRNAKAVLQENNVDYLVPEATSDIRFTRRVTHELLDGPQELYSLEAIQAGLRSCFLKNDTARAVPLPLSALVTLPSYLLGSASKDHTLGESITAEYLYLPVNDAQGGTQIYEYGFQNQRLLFSFYDGGPFEAFKTDGLSLEMGLQTFGENDSAAPARSPQEEFKEFKAFYTAACALAFELDLV
ncbi:mitochondrial inner-membrane-bound regulator-domain-containing protein [Aspergillus granulosus]|uniref:Mitochondrial inner-membrane-bound regulator-domain-containing protein n=1 Tax=Aspergillus granulosus TaxID=176169 RepID=A0ABR4I428_9EURO